MTPEFEKYLSWGGTPTAQCACGRTHYTLSGDFMEPGELDLLEANRKRDPDTYIGDPYNDSVSIASFNGGPTYVWNCPCEGLDKIETRLWNMRKELLQYYRDRAARELLEAKATAQSIEENIPAT